MRLLKSHRIFKNMEKTSNEANKKHRLQKNMYNSVSLKDSCIKE